MTPTADSEGRCQDCGHDLRDHKTTMAGGFWCWICPDSHNCTPPPNEQIGGTR